MSPMAEKNPHQQGRLRSRPVPTPVGKAPVGLGVLGSDHGPAEGYLYLPAGCRAEDASPLWSSCCTAREKTHVTASRS